MTPSIICVNCAHSFNPNNYDLCPKCKTSREDSQPDGVFDEVYEYKYSLNRSIREGGVPLFTTFEVPGKIILESLGMISGVGNAMFTLTGTSTRITNRATTKALNQLFAEAKRIEADAIVGVNLALDSFGKAWVHQLAVYTGTAVKFKK